jgi:hypothetical protein
VTKPSSPALGSASVTLAAPTTTASAKLSVAIPTTAGSVALPKTPASTFAPVTAAAAHNVQRAGGALAAAVGLLAALV